MLILIPILYLLQLGTSQNICFNIPGASTQFTNNPTSCSAWIACQNGKAVNTGNCDPGYNFDAKTANCVPALTNQCASSPLLNICSGKLDGSYVANPQNCKGYFYCKQNVGFPGLCEKNFIFNSTLNRCIDYPNYVCPSGGGNNLGEYGDGSLLCDYFPNGSFLANPNNCSNYYVCQNGEMASGSCGLSYYFNPATSRCDHPRNVKCPSEEVLVPSKNATLICMGTYDNNDKFAGNTDSCTEYYYCPDGAFSTTAIPGTCPDGLFFDYVSATCSEYGYCLSNPCVDKPVGFFDRDPYDCRVYYYCGEEARVWGQCPYGYQFDMGKQICGLPDDVNCTPGKKPPPPPASSTAEPSTQSPSSTSTSISTSTSTPPLPSI